MNELSTEWKEKLVAIHEKEDQEILDHMTMNEQILSFIREKKITLEIQPLADRTDGFHKDNDKIDPLNWLHYRFRLQRNNKTISIEFTKGLGIPQRQSVFDRGEWIHIRNAIAKRKDRKSKSLGVPVVYNLKKHTGKSKQEWIECIPDETEILYAFNMDIIDLYESFKDFCWNFGYDNDSIKAKKIYDTMQDHTRAMFTIFNQSEIEELQEILQDY